MNLSLVLALTIAFMNTNFAQDKTLIADGTLDVPVKYALQPEVEKLSAREIEAVKKEALERQVVIGDSQRKAMSAEESVFKKDFELLDAAEGFFIYREAEFRAYLYTAYSPQMRRNYQGIIVLKIYANGTKFETAAHYVYAYHGDKHLRQLPDINGNVLSELAIYSEPPSKKGFRKEVRIIEFSPNGLVKIGSRVIYSSLPQQQLTPRTADKSQPAKRVYTPPEVSAVKLYVVKKLGVPVEFYEESWSKNKDPWVAASEIRLLATGPDEDKTAYVELVKPIFPKGPGEK